jgi:predicted nucleic acid-binding protein
MSVFFDSNVLVYAFTGDPRSLVAYRLLQQGGVVSAQSLNELANVLRRKQGWDWRKIGLAIETVVDRCPRLVVLDLALHQLGVRLAERYTLSIYDGMIAAAAVVAGCETLYSEDMHHGLVIDGRVRIVNPFAPA